MGNCCGGSGNRAFDPQRINPVNPSVVSEEEKIDVDRLQRNYEPQEPSKKVNLNAKIILEQIDKEESVVSQKKYDQIPKRQEDSIKNESKEKPLGDEAPAKSKNLTLAQIKMLSRKKKQETKTNEESNVLFDTLMNFAQTSEFSEENQNELEKNPPKSQQINSCLVLKEYSGLGLLDYCFKNQNAKLIKYLLERVDLNLMDKQKEDLANSLFKSLISSSKQFNKTPGFFFEFLEFIETIPNIGNLFTIYLNSADPSSFLQFLDLESVKTQEFLTRVRELIERSLSQENQKKEVDLLKAVMVFQNKFKLSLYFSKEIKDINQEQLEKDIGLGFTEFIFDNRFFNICQQNEIKTTSNILVGKYTFALHLAQIDRIDLLQTHWNLLRDQIFTEDSSNNTAASHILRFAGAKEIIWMIDKLTTEEKDTIQAFSRITNNRKQNIFHMILLNKKLKDNEIMELSSKILDLNNVFEETNMLFQNLLSSFDADYNLPFTLLLKTHKNVGLDLIKLLLPESFRDNERSQLSSVKLPLSQYQQIQKISALRLQRLQDADIKVDVETIIAFNNEIIQMILNLKTNRKEVSELVFKDLNFALFENCYEKLLLQGLETMADKWIEQQEILDEQRKNTPIESIQFVQIISDEKLRQKVKKQLESLKISSALDVVVTTYLRSESKEIELPDKMKQLLFVHLKTVLSHQANTKDNYYLTQQSNLQIKQACIQENHFQVASKIRLLKRENFPQDIQEIIKNQGPLSGKEVRVYLTQNIELLGSLKSLPQDILAVAIEEKPTQLISKLNGKLKEELYDILTEGLFESSSNYKSILKDTNICRILVSRDKFSQVLLQKKLKSVNTKLIIPVSKDFIRTVFEAINPKDIEEWQYFQDSWQNFVEIKKAGVSFSYLLSSRVKEESHIKQKQLGNKENEKKEKTRREKENQPKNNNNHDNDNDNNYYADNENNYYADNMDGDSSSDSDDDKNNNGKDNKSEIRQPQPEKPKENDDTDNESMILSKKNGKLTLDLSQKRNIEYYIKYGERILSGLICSGLVCSDVKLHIRLPQPSFSQTKELVLELLASKKVYLRAFGKMMITGQQIQQVLISSSEYFEIFSQISLTSQEKSIELLTLALSYLNSQAAVWLLQKISNPKSLSLDVILKYCNQLRTMTSTESNIQERWEIFEGIKKYIGVDEKQEISNGVILLYEVFGSACPSAEKLKDNPTCIASSYKFLIAVIQKIYLKQKNSQIRNSLNHWILFRNNQLEFMCQQFLKEISDDISKNEQIEDRTLKSFTFVYLELFPQIMPSEPLTKQLLELGQNLLKSSITPELIGMMIQAFLQMYQNNQGKYLESEVFVDKIILPLFVKIHQSPRYLDNTESQPVVTSRLNKLGKTFASSYQSRKNIFKKIKDHIQEISEKQKRVKQSIFEQERFRNIDLATNDFILFEAVSTLMLKKSQKESLLKIMSAYCFLDEKIYQRKNSNIRFCAAYMEGSCRELETMRGIYRTLWIQDPIILNRNLNLEDMLYVVKSIDETTREISTKNKTKGYILREQLEKILLDTALHGQVEKWNALADKYSKSIAMVNPWNVLKMANNAVLGLLLNVSIEDRTTLTQRQKMFFQNEDCMLIYEAKKLSKMQRTVVEGTAKKSMYLEIIQNCLNILQTKKQTDFQEIEQKDVDSDYTEIKHKFMDHDISYSLKVIFLLILIDFPLGLASIKVVRQNSSKIDSEWLTFIEKAICFGALSACSPWNPQELQLFFDNLGEDYISLLFSKENGKDNFNLIPLQSPDSDLNAVYVKFLIKYKNQFQEKELKMVEILIDSALRKALITGDSSKDSKEYLLDAAAQLGVHFINFYTESEKDKTKKQNSLQSQIIEKDNPKSKYSKVRIYSSKEGSKTNSLSYYLSRLNDFDLNHALELNLFSLADKCSAPCHYSKFDFLGSMEELETESQDEYDEDRRIYAARFLLLKGRTSFVMMNFKNILKYTYYSSDVELVKLHKCVNDALISGSVELVKFILNKIGTKQEQLSFIKNEDVLFRLLKYKLSHTLLIDYIIQIFLSDSQSSLMNLNELLREECLIIRGLTEFGLEQSLMQLLSHLFTKPLNDENKQKIIVGFSKTSTSQPISIYKTLLLCSHYEVICFLKEKDLLQDADIAIEEGNDDQEEDEEQDQNHIPLICKYHQLHNLKPKNGTKELSSKSELFTHTKVIFEFLLTELTKLTTSLKTIQLLEQIIFRGGEQSKKYVNRLIKQFVSIQFPGGIYILSEIFRNFNTLLQQFTVKGKIIQSELLNIYMLKLDFYSKLDLVRIAQENQEYFKTCSFAKTLITLETPVLRKSMDFLRNRRQNNFVSLDEQEKKDFLTSLLLSAYHQKQLIKVICQNDKDLIIQDENILQNVIFQQSDLVIALLEDYPQQEAMLEQFQAQLISNDEDFKIAVEHVQDEWKIKRAQHTTKIIEEDSSIVEVRHDNPLNKVLRQVLYYFSVKKGESVMEIYSKIFTGITIISKHGISFQYHLSLMKNLSSNLSLGQAQKAQISLQDITDLIQEQIYEKEIQEQAGNSEYFHHTGCNITILFNSFLKDLKSFIDSQDIPMEQQYQLFFQTAFRFFQIVFSLHLIDAFPDKKLEIYLEQSNNQISLTRITQTEVKIVLSYQFTNNELSMDAKDTYQIQEQIENFYFAEVNLPFIVQQIELFNNHKDNLVRSSQFGNIPFTFSYESIEKLPLTYKREILSQFHFRSSQALKDQLSQRNSERLPSNSNNIKKNNNFDSNSYLGLYQLVEEISRFLSFLNIRQSEFYALNDMFAPHNSATMNPTEAIPPRVENSNLHSSSSQTGMMTSSVREHDVLNRIKMQGAIYSYYLEQLPDNTYKVGVRKNQHENQRKRTEDQLIFSEFYEFCPFPDGEIEIVNISPQEFKEKTSPIAVYNTILAQILSYEQRFHCSLKQVTDSQNLDCKWYYAMQPNEHGVVEVLHKKELFAGYNILKLKQMMNEFENEISFGRREDLHQKWKLNTPSLFETGVSNLFNLSNNSSAQDCQRCGIDRDSIFSLANYILCSPLLKKIIHINLFQNFFDSGNIIKVIKGIYFEFNEIDSSELPKECADSRLDDYLDYGFDQIVRFGKTEYYINKFMLVIRLNICFLKQSLSSVKFQIDTKQRQDMLLNDIPVLKAYIQTITSSYDFYEQLFSPEQIVSFILNKIEIDNHLLGISQKLSKQFTQTITINIHYESLYHIFKRDLLAAQSTTDSLLKMQKYDTIWRGLEGLRGFFLDSFEKHLQQQLSTQEFEDAFFTIFKNLLQAYETKQSTKKQLMSNYRQYSILENNCQENKDAQLADKQEKNDLEDIQEELMIEDQPDDANNAEQSTIGQESKLFKIIYQLRSDTQIGLKNTFLIQPSLNYFILNAKRGDICLVGFSLELEGTQIIRMVRIAEKYPTSFLFSEYTQYDPIDMNVSFEELKFGLFNYHKWPHPAVFPPTQIVNYAIIDASYKVLLMNSRAIADICKFYILDAPDADEEIKELMPSVMNFTFEVKKQDQEKDSLLPSLSKIRSIIGDVTTQSSKQIAIQLDGSNYKFKPPKIRPDELSFASIVDSNPHIQDEQFKFCEILKQQLKDNLLRDISENLSVEFGYEQDLEEHRAIHIEQIERIIDFICSNILDAFKQFTHNTNLSAKMIKIIHLLQLGDPQYEKVISNELQIMPYLLTKLLLKHINILRVNFQLLSCEEGEDFQKLIKQQELTYYENQTKCLTLCQYLGTQSNQVSVPTFKDIFTALLKQIISQELQYLSEQQFNKESDNTNRIVINQGFKNQDISFKFDNKKLDSLIIPHQESFVAFLSTLYFRIKHQMVMYSLMKKNPKRVVVSFMNQSTKSISILNPSDNVLNITLSIESLSESCNIHDLIDGINESNKTTEISASSIFSNSCFIDLIQFSPNDTKTTIVKQFMNNYETQQASLPKEFNEQDFEIRLCSLSESRDVVTVKSSFCKFDDKKILSLGFHQLEDQLKDNCFYYVYAIFYQQIVVSWNIFIKNTTPILQNILKQSKHMNYKVKDHSFAVIQAKDPQFISDNLLDGFNIAFIEGDKNISLPLSTYIQRFPELLFNKFIRLAKVNYQQDKKKEKTVDTLLFDFEITTRYLTKDILGLSITNSKAQQLQIKSSFVTPIFCAGTDNKSGNGRAFDTSCSLDPKFIYQSTQELLLERTQLIGSIIEDKPMQDAKSKASQKQDGKKNQMVKNSPLFNVFRMKAEKRLDIFSQQIRIITSIEDLKKISDIQSLIFMEDGRQNFYSRAGQKRQDVFNFRDSYGNIIKPDCGNAHLNEQYQVVYVHVQLPQIAFFGTISETDGFNRYVSEWTPLIKGSYKMYINGVYVPLSEDNIGVIANSVNNESIKVEVQDVKKISFFDAVECQAYFKDRFGNSFTEFDLKQSGEKVPITATHTTEKGHISLTQTNSMIDKNGKMKISLVFSPPSSEQNIESLDDQGYLTNVLIFYDNIYLKQLEITVRGLNFDKRKKQFEEKVSKFKKGNKTVNINRERFAEDLLNTFENLDLKNSLFVKFKNESGIDAGGLSREFYELVGKMIKDNSYQFFQLVSDSKAEKYYFHPNCLKTKQATKYFNVFGKLIAHTILYNSLLGVDFCEPLFKLITKQNLEFQDLQYIVDAQTFNNYKYLQTLKSDELEDLCMTFSIQNNNKQIELLPNGNNIEVNYKNLDQYLLATAKYYLQTRFAPAINSLIEGFESVFPGDSLRYFYQNELCVLTCGVKAIDGSLLQNLAKYNGGNSILINFFKRYLSEASKEMLTNFLKFITGSSSIPYDYSQFSLQIEFRSSMNQNNLPISHTCFRSIEVPHYKSYEQMKGKFDIAFLDNEGFGFG